MNASTKILKAAAGTSAAGGPVTIDQVFSTFLYTGNATTRTIQNGIDLTEGGLVWTKARSNSDAHVLYDTERGTSVRISTNDADGNATDTNEITSFNSNGYTVNSAGGFTNDSSTTYASWTWRKAPKFFTIIEYSGNGASSERSISHDLGGAVGAIFVKRTDTSDNWYVGCWKGMPQNNGWKLNTAESVSTYGYFGTTAPTSSTFHVSGFNGANANGGTYIAYIFADNSSEDAENQLIKCGSWTGTGSVMEVNLGWPAQWVLGKRSDSSGSWEIFDMMRGNTVTGASDGKAARLEANVSDAEGTTSPSWCEPTSTGFRIKSSFHYASSRKWIFMAIRAPMMAEPTDATKVFALQYARAAQDGVKPEYRSGFPVDMRLTIYRSGGSSSYPTVGSRLTGNKYMATSSAAQEGVWTEQTWDFMNGFMNTAAGSTNSTLLSYMWKRAKGYFDVVAYTGTGSARTVAHGLGVAPEMMWIKSRSSAETWGVYHGDETNYMTLNNTELSYDSAAFWNDTAPTSSVFTVNTQGIVNNNNQNYIAYLFATLANVSKVGSYVGGTSAINIDCGFNAGSSARFVMIKNASSAGSWMFWDTTRGLVAGNDKVIALESTSAENYIYFNGNYSLYDNNVDWIDPYSTGFTVSNTGSILQNDGDTYIFYAIA